MATFVLQAHLERGQRARDRLLHSSKRIYPIARRAAGEVLDDIYLPALREFTPVGRHWSDPNQHPYEDGEPRLGGGLRDAFRIVRLTTSNTLARVEVSNEEDEWGVSAVKKFDLTISGRQRRYIITPDDQPRLTFLWENAPESVLSKQKGKNPGKRGGGNGPANMVSFQYVRAGRYKANKFHEDAWDDVKDSLRGRLADEVRHKLTFELQ